MKNPTSNAFAISDVTFTLPSGWTFDTAAATCGPTYLTTVTEAALPTGTVECSGAGATLLDPGFTTVLAMGHITGPASPATSPAVVGLIATSIIDAGSSPAAYAGPSITEYSITAGTTVSGVTPGTTAFTAGSSPLTVTATLSSGQQGVPVTFSITSGGYPDAGYTASLSPGSGSTGATGKVSTTFTPSNDAGDATSITASIDTSPATTGASGVITTGAATPSKVTFTLSGGAFPTTHYMTVFDTTTFFISGVTTFSGAEEESGTMAWYTSDAFANDVTAYVSGTSTTLIAATPSTGAAYFDISTPLPSTDVIGGVSSGVVPDYFQTGIFGTIGKITATVSGTVTSTSTPFSVSGFTGNLVTSTFQAAVQPTPGAYGSKITGTCNPGDCSVQAGNSFTVSATYGTMMADSQQGVPLTLYALTCGDSAGSQTGTFTGSGASKITIFTNSSGKASAPFKADTTAGDAVQFESNVSAPTDANPAAWLGASALSGCVDTTPGAAAQFLVTTYLDSDGTDDPVTGGVVAGSTDYVVISLADAFGNAVTVSGVAQIQIALSANLGVLSATTIYIPAGESGTNCASPCFGIISLSIPGSTAIGTTITLTAVGPINGATVTSTESFPVVSPLPALGVRTPKLTGGVFYTNVQTVIFTGTANVSKGYTQCEGAENDCITSVGFKVNSNPWLSAAIATSAKVTWSVAATFPVGLNTIRFNASDTNGNTALGPINQLLVDTSPPTITFPTGSSNTGSLTVTIADSLGDFNTTSVTGTWGTTAIPASSISVTGTNTVGSPSSFQVTFAGLAPATQTLTVTAKDYAGNSATGSATETVTVQPGLTFTSSGAGLPTVTTQGGFNGVAVTFVNNGPATSAELICFELFNSANQVVQGPTCFGGPVAGGASIPAFFSFQSGLAHGAYTAKLYVTESGNSYSPVYSTAVTL